VKTYRPFSPEQSFLLPPSPTEWLPEDHLVYFVLDLLADKDLSAFERVVQAKDPRGERPFAPRMMLGLLVYGYSVGIFSSRKLERATHENVAVRVLAGGEHPHFTTINEFRLRHRAAFAELFHQVLEDCMSAGLVKLGHVAIDGTKMKANASKHKAMSYDRMKKDEARLKAEIEELISQAEATDAAEDATHGVGQPQSDLPAELRRREGRRALIKANREAIEREAAKARAAQLTAQADELRANAEDPACSEQKRSELETKAAQREQESADLDDDKPDPPAVNDDLPRNTRPMSPDGRPKPKAQRNFTDPDSRIMMRDGGFLQAYNAQLAVDEGHQIIVAAVVGNQGPDAQYFEPVLRRVVDNCDAVPEATTADSGYFSADNVRAAENLGTEPYIAVGAHRNDGSQDDEPATVSPRRANFFTPERAAMHAKLATNEGHARYARRKATVEPVIGQIRTRGFQGFSLRGLIKVRCEWLLVAATHNILKLWRAIGRTGLAELAA
jgi:transposase